MAALQSERADRQAGAKEEVLFNNGPKPKGQEEFVETVESARGMRDISDTAV